MDRFSEKTVQPKHPKGDRVSGEPLSTSCATSWRAFSGRRLYPLPEGTTTHQMDCFYHLGRQHQSPTSHSIPPVQAVVRLTLHCCNTVSAALCCCWEILQQMRNTTLWFIMKIVYKVH